MWRVNNQDGRERRDERKKPQWRYRESCGGGFACFVVFGLSGVRYVMTVVDDARDSFRGDDRSIARSPNDPPWTHTYDDEWNFDSEEPDTSLRMMTRPVVPLLTHPSNVFSPPTTVHRVHNMLHTCIHMYITLYDMYVCTGSLRAPRKDVE